MVRDNSMMAIGRRMACVAVLSVMVVGCDSITGASNVDYRVTGGAQRVSLTYETEGGTSQITTATLPWSYARKAKSGDFLYVSAQIVEGTGTITATIHRGGDVFKSATATGFASIATASGSMD